MLDLWPLLSIPLTMLFTISISWTQSRGAPWVPTSLAEVDKMLALAEVGPNDMVYDLGCGDGRTIIMAARRYNARAVGIEIDPLRYLWCQLLITVFLLRGRVKIVGGDFFKKDLSEAEVVTCYLLQSTNEKLQDKLLQELHPSARVVSNDFTFPKLKLRRMDRKDQIDLYRPLPA